MKSSVYYLSIIFLIGLSSLIYQIYCVRILFIFYTESISAVSISIAAFLAGLSLSSIVFSRIPRTENQSISVLFYMQFFSALYGILFLTNYDLIPLFIDNIDSLDITKIYKDIFNFLTIWTFLFIPAFFIGGAFPIVYGLYLRSTNHASQDTGLVYFIDMFAQSSAHL